jgi:hypothetical protein
MNEVDEELPRLFQTLIRLAEVAKEKTQNVEGQREMHNRKTRLEDNGGANAKLAGNTSAHTTAVSTIPKGGTRNE